MNLEDAIIVLLEATREMEEDQATIRRARKKLAAKAESLRLKRERRKNRELFVTSLAV